MREKKRLLITDDDPAMQDALELILNRAGYLVTAFHDGNELLRDDYLLPDLFLLDKQLSGVDGLDICRFLRKCDRSSQVPVIMMSASPNIELLSLEAGADAFIEKPFRMQVLLDCIAACLLAGHTACADLP